MSKRFQKQPLPRHVPSGSPAEVQAALQNAVALHQRGQLVEAEQMYRNILRVAPDHFDATRLLGVVLLQRRQLFEGEQLIARALQIKPNDPSALNNRGNALKELQRFDEALASYDRAIALKPDNSEAFNNRGVVLKELKRFDEALISYDKAVTLKPDYPEAFNNRGNTLRELNRFDEALVSYDKAVALKPNYAEAFNNRGNVLTDLKRLDEALASYDKAIALKADYVKAFNNRGNTLRELNRFDEALVSYDKAIALNPNYAEAFNNRGNVLRDLKRIDEALASYDEAIAIKPNYADGYLNRALSRLLVGRYQEAWTDYEWRWEAKDFLGKRPNIRLPTWRGEDLSGHHLLVFSEQGMGDIIQFARYLPLLAESKCKITFTAPANLIRLLRLSIQSVEIVSELDCIQGIDFQIALMSLPQWFNTELSSIPHTVPYLTVEPELEAHWRSRIGAQGFKIGIAWQGNPSAKIDAGRSVPLEEFFRLSHIPGVRLISLQKHTGLDQLARLPRDVKIEVFDDDLDSGPDSFIDTAAAMNSLDLIITSDTSIAHLAGALGRPTWVALRHVPDWRWLLDRNDSPWYPTLRLFRQPQRDEWTQAFARIEQELKRRVEER